MIKNAKTFPPDPTPKYPPRRNGLDWHGLQRCGNHWDIFCFRHADKKAPHRSNRVTSSATPETLKRLTEGLLWRRCGNFERDEVELQEHPNKVLCLGMNHRKR